MAETTDEYAGEITLVWDEGSHDWPEGIDAKVIADIRESLWGLSEPSDLSFHIITLTDREQRGPGVVVCGKEGSPAFHCSYVKGVTNAG